MKIVWDQRELEFIEVLLKENRIEIVLSAKDPDNPRKRIVNCAELTQEEFKELFSEVLKSLDA